MKARRELHPAGYVPDLAVRYYSFLMHCLICCNACYCRHNDCDKSKQHVSRLFLHCFKLLLLLYSRISCYSLLFCLSAFLLYKYIGLTGSAYVAIPCVAPIALGGFYSFNGMNFYEYMGKKLHFMFGNRALTYVSTEGEPE